MKTITCMNLGEMIEAEQALMEAEQELADKIEQEEFRKVLKEIYG